MVKWDDSTTSSSTYDYDMTRFIDKGTGGDFITEYYYGNWTPNRITVGESFSDTADEPEVSKFVTKKDLKAMKEAVKKYMTTQMKKDAKKAAGQISKDIEKLQKEKTQLRKEVTQIKKEVTQLKESLKQMKKDIRSEMGEIEKMMEKKATALLGFADLDFS